MSKEPVKIKTSDKKAMALLLQETARRASERYKAGEPPLAYDEPFKGEIRDLPGRFGKN